MNTEAKVISPAALAESIKTAWAAFVTSDRRPASKRANVYASAYRACDRQIVLEMTEGDKLPPWQPDTLANFRRGNDRERDILIDMKRIGRACEPAFDVIGEQERFELRDHKGRVAITGKVDARLKFSTGSYPCEVKSWNPNTVARIERFSDLFESRWTRAGAYQLLAYMYAFDEPVGFLILDRNGLPLPIPVTLYDNLDLIESFLSKAERAIDHKEAGTLPDFTTDPDECKYCSFFGSTCNPPLSYGAGAQIITDEETIQKTERLKEIETKVIGAGLEEYETLEKWSKKRFRGVGQAIVGSCMVSGKWQRMTRHDVPEEAQKRIDAEMETYARVDPKGKFFLTITKVQS